MSLIIDATVELTGKKYTPTAKIWLHFLLCSLNLGGSQPWHSGLPNAGLLVRHFANPG